MRTGRADGNAGRGLVPIPATLHYVDGNPALSSAA